LSGFRRDKLLNGTTGCEGLQSTSVMNFRQFLLGGVNHVRGEWDLVCLAYNVKRMHRMQRT